MHSAVDADYYTWDNHYHLLFQYNTSTLYTQCLHYLKGCMELYISWDWDTGSPPLILS